ncbi:gas vesicle protein [Terrabacter sp. NPDC080008]|uniref:gas vesicle protein n=1 Tax=Terrabacter sp. NPDC080008 TaxID=3155176 RepID=UPI003450B21F
MTERATPPPAGPRAAVPATSGAGTAPRQYSTGQPAAPRGPTGGSQPATLADILERILDKGIIIAGDIRINLLDIELLTIKLRLLVVSVDKAHEMGIDWWRHDPMLTVRERGLDEENRLLRERIAQLEGRKAGADADEDADEDADDNADDNAADGGRPRAESDRAAQERTSKGSG